MGPHHGSDEAVTPPDDRRDQSRIAFLVTQGPSEPGHVYLQIAVFDDRGGPDLIEQLQRADDFPRAFNQCHEYRKRTASYFHKALVAQQKLLGRYESEIVERVDVAHGNNRPLCRSSQCR